MTLIRCPECGKEISDSAKTCVECGYPIKKYRNNTSFINIFESINKKILVGIIAIVIVVAILLGVNRSPIRGNWYYIEDDDYWLDIDNNTITLRSVFTDDVYGTIEYKYIRGKRTINVSHVTSTDIWVNEEWLKEYAELLEDGHIYVKNDILHLEFSKNNVHTFSHDEKYKCDH